MGSAAPTTHAKILNAASLLMLHLHCIAEQGLPSLGLASLETLCAWRDFVVARIDARLFDAPDEVMRLARSHRRLRLAGRGIVPPEISIVHPPLDWAFRHASRMRVGVG